MRTWWCYPLQKDLPELFTSKIIPSGSCIKRDNIVLLSDSNTLDKTDAFIIAVDFKSILSLRFTCGSGNESGFQNITKIAYFWAAYKYNYSI